MSRGRSGGMSRGAGGRVLAAVSLALAMGGTAWAAEVRVTTVETFEGGLNEGGWTFGTGLEFFVEDHGNPGRYLRDAGLVSFTPKASTAFGVQSAFTGDYRARHVESVGIDLAIASVNGNVSGRRLTLILLNDNGTPDNLLDDWGAFTVTDLPLPPTGVIGLAGETDILQWASYDIPVASQSGALPAGWSWIARNTLRHSGSWARLMRDVDHVGFIMGDPALIYPLFNWDAGMDNPRITTVNQEP
jgi:hypothetical protein